MSVAEILLAIIGLILVFALWDDVQERPVFGWVVIGCIVLGLGLSVLHLWGAV